MADPKNSKRYENLNRLSTEQLEALLRTAPMMPEDQETSDYFDAIEEVILRRETEVPTGRLTDIDSSWKEFQQHYTSPEGPDVRLYPDEEGSEKAIHSAKFHTKSIFCRVGLVAATVAVVFACMIAAQAAGVDVFGALAHWTEEAFRFNGTKVSSSQEAAQSRSENETYLAIQAEVDKLGISVPVVPTWFPEGYELREIKPSHPDITEWQSMDFAFLNDNDEYLFLTITKYAEGYDISSPVFEKDGQPVVEYISGGKLFYIMSDNKYKTAVWSDGSLMVDISGVLTEETIKTIIDSIGS